MVDTLGIFILGCTYNGSAYLDNPTAAMTAINGALDTIAGLSYSGVHFAFTLNSSTFAIDVTNAQYNSMSYLDEATAISLRSMIMTVLVTIANFTYTDVIVSSSRSV